MPCRTAPCACTVDPRPCGRGGRGHPQGESAHEPEPSLQTVSECVCVCACMCVCVCACVRVCSSLSCVIKGAYLKA